MARQKLSTSEIPIARRAEAIGRGPGPWKEAPDHKNGVGGMEKPVNKMKKKTTKIMLMLHSWQRPNQFEL